MNPIKSILAAAIVALFPIATTMQSCSSKAETADSASTPAQQLRQQLADIAASSRVAIGHHDDPVYGHTWAWDEGRSDVKEVCGDYPAVMSWDLGMIEMADSLNLDSVPFDRMRREAVAHDLRGGFNTFSWHLRNPVNFADSWDVSDTTIVARSLTDSASMANFEVMLHRTAEFFNSLRRPDGSKIGVIFRPWHEHTGSWFWWGEKLCTPEQYKALWKRTREVFDSCGVDNVLWAYSPDRVNSAEEYLERYPGDEYVDIMGIDIYHFGGEDGLDTYRTAVAKGLPIAAAEAASRGKLFAFSETGSESLPMANWWTEVMLPILKQHKPAYVVFWRNAPDKPTHYYMPFPGNHSEESFKAFHADSITQFVNP